MAGYRISNTSGIALNTDNEGIGIPTTNNVAGLRTSGVPTGSIIFNTADSQFYGFNGTSWVRTSTSGTSGSAGTSGSSGTAGTSGSSGTAGTSGSSGTAGTSGITGPQGSQGPQGPQGPIGPQGIQGPIGPQGAQGPGGSSGSSGTAGTSGSSGTAGTSGTSGTQGPQGNAGPQGATGPQGLTGPQGNQGPIGPQGVQGPGGTSGTSGSSGTAGTSGGQGPQGPQGPVGPQGLTGPQGNQGPIGPQGNQGPSGSSGTSGTSGTQGGQGPAGSSGTSGTSGTQGPQGPQGPGVSGTTNYVAKFTSSTALGNSQIFDNGSSVVIGNTSATNGSRFEIIGSGVWNGAVVTLTNTGTSGRSWSIFSTNTTFSQGGGKLLLYNATAGTDAFVVDSSNRLGLGTNDPTERLHLKNSSGTGIFVRFEDTAGGGVYIGGRSENMELYAGGSEKVRIASGGNVGIGTQSPTGLLQLGDGSFTATNTSYKSFHAGGFGVLFRNAQDAYVCWNTVYTASGWLNKYAGRGGIAVIDSAGDFYVEIGTGTTAGSATNLGVKFRVTAGGLGYFGGDLALTTANVSSYALPMNASFVSTVNTNAGFTPQWTNSSTGTASFTEGRFISGSRNITWGVSHNYSSAEWNQAWIYSGAGNLALKTESSYNIRFYLGGYTDGFERIRFDSSGRIISYFNTATGIANNSFNVSKAILGNIHVANGAGVSGDNKQAAITFQGDSGAEAEAGIYVSNNNSSGTAMGFATTDSYGVGPQLFMTATNGGVVNFPRARPTYAGNAILDAANYSSYALPLSGGNLSGNLRLLGYANANIRISTSGGSYSYLELDDGTTSGYLIKNISAGTGNGALAGALYTYTDGGKAFQHIHAGNPRFTILSGGQVGINTTTPDRKLSVNGDSEWNDWQYHGATLGTYTFALGRTGVPYSTGGEAFVMIGQLSGVWTTRFILDHDTGNAGINTTNPTAQMSGTVGLSIVHGTNAALGLSNGTNNWLNYLSGTTYRIWNNSVNEVMTILLNGNVGIGTNSASYKLHVAAGSIQATNDLLLGEEAYSVSSNYIGMKTTFQSGTNDYMILSGKTDGNTYVSAKDGAEVHVRGGGNNGDNEIVVPDSTYILATTSAFRVTGDVIAYYSSDRELKNNISPITEALEKVKAIGGYSFDWNEKQDVYEGHDIGVIAQEIEEVLPEIVTTRDNGYKAVKYEKLTPLLIEAIKELNAKIERQDELIRSLLDR